MYRRDVKPRQMLFKKLSGGLNSVIRLGYQTHDKRESERTQNIPSKNETNHILKTTWQKQFASEQNTQDRYFN